CRARLGSGSRRGAAEGGGPMRHRTRLAVAVVAVGSVAVGLVETRPEGATAVVAPGATQPIDLVTELRCADLAFGFDRSATVHVTGTAPASVAPGQPFELTLSVEVTAPPDLQAISLPVPIDNVTVPAPRVALPSDGPVAVPVVAGLYRPMTLQVSG